MRLWATLIVTSIAMSTMASANGLGLSNAQKRLIEKRLPQQFNMTRLREDEDGKWRAIYAEPPSSNHRETAAWAARRYQIPVSLFLKLVQTESNWNPKAVSHAGAIGLAQLMPGTAKYLEVNPRDPKQNLLGGARYLREQYLRFGSWRLALAAYNAGPEAVARHGGVPPYKETRNYVRRILGN